MPEYDPDKPGTNFINLADEGLTDGDSLDSYISTYFQDGNQVYIPPGTYDFDSNALGDDTYTSGVSLIGDPDGVTANRPGPSTQTTPSMHPDGCEILVENITFKGIKGEAQSRWKAEPQNNGTFTLRNVNWPDGTVSPTDSQVLLCESTGDGEIRFEGCYVGPHGNSTAYIENSTGDVHFHAEDCTFVNTSNTIRPSTGGLTIRNCKVFQDGDVPQFIDPDNGNISGPYSRTVRVKNISSCNIDVDGLHITMTSLCNGPGPVIQNRIDNGLSGNIDNVYLYNETGTYAFQDLDGSLGSRVSSSNIHASGPGELSTDGLGQDGTEMPDQEKIVWTPADGPDGDAGYTLSENTDPSTPNGTIFEIVADSGSGDIQYSFETDGGDVYTVDLGNDVSSVDESNVSATVNENGVITVDGQTGNGWGDAFDVTGTVTSFSASGDADLLTLTWGGQEVVTEDLPFGESDTEPEEDYVTPDELTAALEDYMTASEIEAALNNLEVTVSYGVTYNPGE